MGDFSKLFDLLRISELCVVVINTKSDILLSGDTNHCEEFKSFSAISLC